MNAQTATDTGPPRLPSNDAELATLLENGLEGQEFATVMDQLKTRYGSLRANQMLDSASATVDHDKNLHQAQSDLAAALGDAARNLREARTALCRLTDGDAWHVEYAEGSTGRDMAAFLSDAERYIRAVIALDQPNRPAQDCP